MVELNPIDVHRRRERRLVDCTNPTAAELHIDHEIKRRGPGELQLVVIRTSRVAKRLDAVDRPRDTLGRPLKAVDIPLALLDLAASAMRQIARRTIPEMDGLISEIITIEAFDDIDFAIIRPTPNRSFRHHPHGRPRTLLSVVEFHLKLDLSVSHRELALRHHAARQNRARIGRLILIALTPAMKLSAADSDEIGT